MSSEQLEELEEWGLNSLAVRIILKGRAEKSNLIGILLVVQQTEVEKKLSD